MRSESVGVDVDVSGPGPCLEPRYGFLDFKNVLMRFIVSLMKEREKTSRLHKTGSTILFLILVWRSKTLSLTRMPSIAYHTARS